MKKIFLLGAVLLILILPATIGKAETLTPLDKETNLTRGLSFGLSRSSRNGLLYLTGYVDSAFLPEQGHITFSLSTNSDLNDSSTIFQQQISSDANFSFTLNQGPSVPVSGGTLYLRIDNGAGVLLKQIDYPPINFAVTYYDKLYAAGSIPYQVEQVPYGTLPSDITPHHTGYAFKGWYTDRIFTSSYTPSPISRNIDLYSKWEPIIHKITYHDNYTSLNGLANISSNILDGSQLSNPPQPENRPAYTFKGWYSEADCINPYNFSDSVIADIDIYAKWVMILPDLGSVETNMPKVDSTSSPTLPDPNTPVVDPVRPSKQPPKIETSANNIIAKPKIQNISSSNPPINKGNKLPKAGEEKSSFSLLIGFFLMTFSFLIFSKRVITMNKR